MSGVSLLFYCNHATIDELMSIQFVIYTQRQTFSIELSDMIQFEMKLSLIKYHDTVPTNLSV